MRRLPCLLTVAPAVHTACIRSILYIVCAACRLPGTCDDMPGEGDALPPPDLVPLPAPEPNVNNVNIVKSSRVQIGPKFTTVTQNVNNEELVKEECLYSWWGGVGWCKGRWERGRRCAAALLISWALLLATGLTVYFVFLLSPAPTRLDLGLHAEWYVRRAEWQALLAAEEEFLELPLSYVIVGHSARGYCDTRSACTVEVRSLQKDYLGRMFNDIGSSFLVGGNGYIFEGRGANVLPAMVSSWNLRSVMIMFLGDYQEHITDELQFQHLEELLAELVVRGVLGERYVVYGHCQVRAVIAPGRHVVSQLRSLSRWSDRNLSACPPLV